MATVAVYSLKGGVGKTTLAVNLAWASATQSARRTLLWDLDPQAAASYLLGDASAAHDSGPKDRAQAIFSRDVKPESLIRPTRFERLDLLAADTSLRGLDHLFYAIGKKRRLAKLLDGLDKRYDRIILDCPPGLTDTSEQVMRAADLILTPVIPSPLSQRALGEVLAWLDRDGKRHAPVLPIHSMVDRRRSLHALALDTQADWPVVPMASAVEQMAARRAPIGAFASSSLAGKAFAQLWIGTERKLAEREARG